MNRIHQQLMVKNSINLNRRIYAEADITSPFHPNYKYVGNEPENLEDKESEKDNE